MALRPKKKTRVEEEEEEEEEMEDEEEEDEEEEEVRVLCLNPEDMRDYRGELARQQVFWAAYEALLPPEEGGLSRFWIEKFEGMARAIKALRKRYCYFVRCVFLSIFFFISYSFSSFLLLFYFIFLIPPPPPSHPPPSTQAKGGKTSEGNMGEDSRCEGCASGGTRTGLGGGEQGGVEEVDGPGQAVGRRGWGVEKGGWQPHR